MALTLLAVMLGLVACGRTTSSERPPGRLCPSPASATSDSTTPVFYLSRSDGCTAVAFDYTGKRTGQVLALPSCIEACRARPLAPDGWLPSDQDIEAGLTGTLWTTDGRHLCGFAEGVTRPIRLGWKDVRTPQHTASTTFDQPAFNYQTVSMVSCDLGRDQAVLVGGSSSTALQDVAVVSLRRPRILFERHLPGGATAVSVSPNGQFMAVQPTPPAPVEIYALGATLHLVQKITGRHLVGWSGDGREVITQPHATPGDGVVVQRVTDDRALWQTSGAFGTAVSAPGSPTLVIQLFDPVHRRDRIFLVDSSGHGTPLSFPGRLLSPQP